MIELGVLYLPAKHKGELMQFTGLKDKNGKEIYEGDIIGWKSTRKVKKWTYREVVKDIREFYANMINERSDGAYWHYEIIGNIYENPELLKL